MPEDASRQVSEQVKSSILKAIEQSLASEKPSLERLGGLAGAVARLDGVDLYGKNTPGDGYAKNTTALERAEDVSNPAEIISRAKLRAGES